MGEAGTSTSTSTKRARAAATYMRTRVCTCTRFLGHLALCTKRGVALCAMMGTHTHTHRGGAEQVPNLQATVVGRHGVRQVVVCARGVVCLCA